MCVCVCVKVSILLYLLLRQIIAMLCVCVCVCVHERLPQAGRRNQMKLLLRPCCLRAAAFRRRTRRAHRARAERRHGSPPTAGDRGRGPLRPHAAAAIALSRRSTASRTPRAALRRAGGAAPAQMAHLARAERWRGSPPTAGGRGRGPPIPPAAAARALSPRCRHAPARGFWKPPEGADTVGPWTSSGLSRNLEFRRQNRKFVTPTVDPIRPSKTFENFARV